MLAGDFGGPTLLSGVEVDTAIDANDGFLSAIGPAGSAFARRFGGQGTQSVRAAAVVSDGFIVLGSFDGALDLDGAPIEAEATDVFIAKVAP